MKITIEIDFEGDDSIEMTETFLPSVLALVQKESVFSKDSAIVVIDGFGEKTGFRFPELH